MCVWWHFSSRNNQTIIDSRVTLRAGRNAFKWVHHAKAITERERVRENGLRIHCGIETKMFVIFFFCFCETIIFILFFYQNCSKSCNGFPEIITKNITRGWDKTKRCFLEIFENKNGKIHGANTYFVVFIFSQLHSYINYSTVSHKI